MPLSSGGTKKGRTDSQNVQLIAPLPRAHPALFSDMPLPQEISFLLSLLPAALPPWLLQATCPPGIHLAGVRLVGGGEGAG